MWSFSGKCIYCICNGAFFIWLFNVALFLYTIIYGLETGKIKSQNYTGAVGLESLMMTMRLNFLKITTKNGKTKVR